MKNIVKQISWVLLLLFVVASCRPMEEDAFSLGNLTPMTADQLSFSQQASPASGNIVTFTNTSTIPGVYSLKWDLGNGSTGNSQTLVGQYPYKGEYTVTLTVYTPDGSSVTKSQVVTITDNDFSLIDTPNYRNLTGGIENVNGKTWVFDQYYPGHFGVGPVGGSTPEWWSAPANGKEGSSLYTQKFTFYQDGTRLKWENNGYIYTNGAGVAGMGNPAGIIENPGGVGDFDVPYVPADNYTFSLDESTMSLTLSGNAFFGFYVGNSTYQILSLTEDELYVKVASVVENGNGWWFRFVPEDKNVPPPVVVKAVPLSENFEVSPLKLTFAGEDMGSKSGVVDNPLPLPINESAKVYRYQKTNAFYTNLFWTAPDYKFDLTTQHKVRLKVMIPSYNDYTTENNVAGDWISEKRLRPQLAIKLQNKELGGNAWTTQTEIIKKDLEMDKWLDLEFDFVGVKDRKDYDKIVIQFGSEGQSGTGFFFFDDFTFSE